MKLTVNRYDRMENSINGNPRYKFYFDEGIIAKSARDSSFVFTLPNNKYMGQQVEVQMDGGEITHMEPVTEEK